MQNELGLIPTFESYGKYASGNYGVNSIRFTFPNGLEFYYSYSTLVAFRSIETGLVVSKNIWSTTTGKHLNWIDGGRKDERYEYSTMQKKLQDILRRYRLTIV